jgi:D-glycero-D-manno-heptose 1,7-bisphosphate phosphatase
LKEQVTRQAAQQTSQSAPQAPQTTQQRPARPAVFLDRDGTICEEMGYLNHISRLHIFPFAAAAIRRFNDAGLPVIVVTNQSGVSRGIFPEALIAEVHSRILQAIAAAGARIDAFYYCTHTRADDCQCRKPLPGLLQQAAREHNLLLSDSFVVGDRYADIELAHAVGGRGLLVLSGYGRGEYESQRHEWKRQPDDVVEDLSAAADVIIDHLNKIAAKQASR